MDLRVVKTKKLIINAFLQIRAGKPLEKITVREITEAAMINKSTFYSHFRDIFDLSDTLENEIIDDILRNIPHAENILEMPYEVTTELFNAYRTRSQIFNTVFGHGRNNIFVDKLEERIKSLVFEAHPEMSDNLKANLYLSLCVQGFPHAYLSYSGQNDDTVIKLLAEISDLLSDKLLNDCNQRKNSPQ